MADEEFILHHRNRKRLRNYKDWNRTSYFFSKQQRHCRRRRVYDEPDSKKKKHEIIVLCDCCCCVGVNKIVPTLPNDVVSEILVRLPPDILYYVMRHVCKNWRQLIDDPDFVNAHLHRSPSSYTLLAPHGSLFIPNPDYDPTIENRIFQEYDRKILVNPERKSSQLHLHNYKWNKILQVDNLEDMILDSCDGLVLVFKKEGFFHVLNPITNQKIILPRQPIGQKIILPRQPYKLRRYSRPIGAIACSKSSKKYKAFQAYATGATRFQYKISVLTLGVDDSWRSITADANVFEFDQPHQSLSSSVAVLSVGGFVYFHVCNKTVLFALDVEDETIQRVPAPNHDQPNSTNHITEYQYIKSGRFLFFVLNKSFNVHDFWALMDPKTEDWRKLYRIDLNNHNGVQSCINKFSCTIRVRQNLLRLRERLDQLRPLLVLEEDVVLFYFPVDRNNNLYVGYKVKTDEFFCMQLGRSLMKGVVHLETLVAIQ